MNQYAVSIQKPENAIDKVAEQEASPPPLPSGCDLQEDQFTFESAPPVLGTDVDKQLLTTQTDTDSGEQSKTHTRSLRPKAQSTISWLVSLILHAAGLLLLLLILAPADFGRTSMDSLLITFSQEAPEVDVTVLDANPGDAGSDSTIEDSATPLLNSFQADLLSGRMQALTEESVVGRAGRASGSFFGIEASGHKFVYIVDMSGSMKGRRFDRATSELLRSVEQLGPHQSFYVLLFSSGSTQMFGHSGSLPKPIAATTENKQQLAEWLLTAFEGGGTDPREALGIALRIDPSAIFMLSDGEFNGRKNQKQDKLLGGNADAFSIVSAASSKTPIHSIAFEDRSSRGNMQRLAEMTNGEFRFVPLENGIDPAVAMQEARAAMQQGEIATATLRLHKAAVNLEGDEGEEAKKTKVEVCEALLELARQELEDDKPSTAQMALSEIVRMDEQASVTDEAQAWLIEKLLTSLQDNENQTEAAATLKFLSDVLQQSPRSKAAERIRDPLAQMHLDQARQLHEAGQTLPAIRSLEVVMTTLSKASAYQECLAKHERIGKELIEQARTLRRDQGDVVSAQHLRQLVVDASDTLLRHEISQTLENQAREMLLAVRDARLVRDRMKLRELQQQLSDGFSEDPLLEHLQQELTLNERQAQAMLNTAIQLERSSKLAARGKYRALIQNFSGTLAARRAEGRVRFLGW